MNASVQASGDGPSKDEVLKYARKKTREAESGSAPADAPPPGDQAQRAAPERTAPEPPWRRSQQRSGNAGAAFAGDVATAELRTKLALAPDRLPEPPPASSGSKLTWPGRITSIVVAIAVGGVVGYRWGSSPGSRFPLLHPSSHARQAVAPDRSITAMAPGPADGLPITNAMPTVYSPPAPPPSGGSPFRQLTIGHAPTLLANDIAKLAISASDAGVNAAVVISGLAPGSALSVGTETAPGTWRLSVEDLSAVSMTPPQGFVGAMDLRVGLYLSDGSVADRKSLRLEWLSMGVAATPAPRQRDAAEIAQIMQRGAKLMANGDVTAARLMYRRAAEEGDQTAAFALAETYDPLVPGRGGMAADVGLAQIWYAKARDLGAPQARERLERLAQWDP